MDVRFRQSVWQHGADEVRMALVIEIIAAQQSVDFFDKELPFIPHHLVAKTYHKDHIVSPTDHGTVLQLHQHRNSASCLPLSCIAASDRADMTIVDHLRSRAMRGVVSFALPRNALLGSAARRCLGLLLAGLLAWRVYRVVL